MAKIGKLAVHGISMPLFCQFARSLPSYSIFSGRTTYKGKRYVGDDFFMFTTGIHARALPDTRGHHRQLKSIKNLGLPPAHRAG